MTGFPMSHGNINEQLRYPFQIIHRYEHSTDAL